MLLLFKKTKKLEKLKELHTKRNELENKIIDLFNDECIETEDKIKINSLLHRINKINELLKLLNGLLLCKEEEKINLVIENIDNMYDKISQIYNELLIKIKSKYYEEDEINNENYF